MKSDYLQEAADVMSRCLIYGHEGPTLDNTMSSESLAIYLAVACTALGEPSTTRWVSGIQPAGSNTIWAETQANLEARNSVKTSERLMSLLEGLLDLNNKRVAIIEAGMPAPALDYILRDTQLIVRHLMQTEVRPVPVLESRFHDLTRQVCEQARDRLQRLGRTRTLERAARVIFGAAARVTAAKLSGGISMVLDILGEASITKGLEQ